VWAVLVGSIDQGTTGTRFTIYDGDANRLGYSYREHRQIYPEPGWVEQDPLEILENTKRVMREAVSMARVDPVDIGAIGVTNQRETTILWNRRTGRPVENAVVWQCRRTAPLVERLKEAGYRASIREKTGLEPDAYFSGPKIWWLLDNHPGARRMAEDGDLLFGNVDTWLIWCLTGSHVTDFTNASRTMLFDIGDLRWDQELMDINGGIPGEILPEVRPSSDPDPYGYVERKVLGAEIPLCGDLGDQQAALFGQGCLSPGDTKNTYGTGNFILMNTGNRRVRSRQGLLTTIAHGYGGRVTYALEGSVFTTGAVLSWMRDSARIVESVEESGKMAQSIPDSGGVHLVPNFAGAGAPHWDMKARGAILGLGLGTTAAQIIRAALESEAYRTREVLEAMQRDSRMEILELRVDGGGSRNDFTMQFQSDLLGIPLLRSGTVENTSLGAAFAAGLAVALWEGPEELCRMAQGGRLFEPGISRERGDRLYSDWRAAMDSALDCSEILGGYTG